MHGDRVKLQCLTETAIPVRGVYLAVLAYSEDEVAVVVDWVEADP